LRDAVVREAVVDGAALRRDVYTLDPDRLAAAAVDLDAGSARRW
jgi:hypothetical protein